MLSDADIAHARRAQLLRSAARNREAVAERRRREDEASRSQRRN